MAPDGRSFVTAVKLQSTSLWIHDANGERQISLEGNGTIPKFTPDGAKLCYLIVKEAPDKFIWRFLPANRKNQGELRIADLKSGRSEPLVRGIPTLDYDVSADGRRVVLWSTDREGKPRLWLAPLDRSSSPVQIPNVEGESPKFGPGGDIFFRHLERTSTFVYRVHPDGTGLQKVIAAPVFLLHGISPDSRWIYAWAQLPGNGPPSNQAFPMNGGPPIPFNGFTFLSWTLDGRTLLYSGFQTYLVPLRPGEALPEILLRGSHSEEEIARLPGARRIDEWGVVPGPSAEVYAFYRGTTLRNLYRIPIP